MKLGALEAGGTKMVCAIGDENGKILKKESFPTLTPEETIPKLYDFFEKEGVEALGIGCFGPICLDKSSPEYGHITTTPKLAWQNYDMVGAFKGLGVPIGFDTDVNGSVLGEHTWGIGKGLHSVLYITIGTGVGVGIILDGKLVHGMMHPEGGHILLTRHEKDLEFPGNCPFHKNCFEGLCAGPAIEKRWGKKGAELQDQPFVWELEAYYIAQALVDYVCIASPQRIILGGGVSHQLHMLPLVREEFKKQMNGYIATKEMEDLDTYIVAQSLDDEQGIMGALKLGLDAM